MKLFGLRWQSTDKAFFGFHWMLMLVFQIWTNIGNPRTSKISYVAHYCICDHTGEIINRIVKVPKQ